MAITIKSQNPAALLAAIKKAIDDDEVETWEYDAHGDFTHTPAQWIHHAWLRPTVSPGQLTFGIVPNQKKILSSLIYGIYHGRFIEMLLSHFEDKFTDAVASAGFKAPFDTLPSGIK